MWCCVGWWNEQWFESDCSIQSDVICFIWLQLISLVISDCEPFSSLKGLFGTPQSFAGLLCVSVWGKLGGHSFVFSHRTLIVMFWLAEAARVIASLEPSISTHLLIRTDANMLRCYKISQRQSHKAVWLVLMLYKWLTVWLIIIFMLFPKWMEERGCMSISATKML